MFSILRPSLVYTDISTDITENDEDYDASEWSYSERTCYRGALDTSYQAHGLDIYWLYDDNLLRIGLAEHEIENHTNFRTLWFYDNPYGTLLQEDGWITKGSIWNLLTSEAYQDGDILLKAVDRIVLPEYLISGFPEVYVCSCGTFFSPRAGCVSVKKMVTIRSPIFIDSSFVIYIPPAGSITERLPFAVPSALPLEQESHLLAEQESPLPEPLLQPQESHLEQPQTDQQTSLASSEISDRS